jgi:ligand-binding sensor domain-containing protein
VPNNQYFLRKLILIFLISFSVKAQLLPPIQSYTPEQYNGANQNWMIDGSSDNKILFSNSEGLLVYDGTTWVKYNSPNGSLIRSVKFIDDLIYTGAHSDFGYWEKLSNGTLYYTSLIKKLNLNLEEDEEFWKILTLDNWIIFQSLHRFIFLDKNSNDVKYLKIDDTIITSFVIDNQIYFSLQSGFYKLINGQPVQIINNKIPSPIVNAFKTNDGLLFLTENDGFYIEKKPGDLSKINSYLDLNNNFSIFSSLKLNDNSFVLGTVGQGLIFLDSNLKYVNKIDKSNGLINNTVLSLYQDFENNIWLGLDNGISVININSPFKIYSDDNGVLGTVYASKVYNNFLYIGTNQGLYYKKNNSNEAFKLMSNTSGQVWSLEEIDGFFFVAMIKERLLLKILLLKKLMGL